MKQKLGPRPNPKYWDSAFARFVKSYGVERLAIALDVHASAVYHWIRGVAVPKTVHVAKIQRVARESGASLSFDEIYGHVSELRANEPAIRAEIERRKEKGRAREEKEDERIRSADARVAAAEFLIKSLGSRRPSVASS
jgi:hypothetical protein